MPSSKTDKKDKKKEKDKDSHVDDARKQLKQIIEESNITSLDDKILEGVKSVRKALEKKRAKEEQRR